ncbi:glutamyl-tRNA(Gln) amidotransferase subunit A [Caldovatus sediminis]|uniref:Glutamyl-tRNA(Gln) amidotransferase subunit A n=1 Tax=Caldovatus sediminis TaxID=2041189 RepID=A0A8J2ZE40_9PROT|nr:amidase [Caldovatus sediminis]GGG43943.1 glutamyl-tRNA(Gln) amidotransferase subunit A [Caldovatus sediminis]
MIPTIAEAARRIAARELSPVELVSACLRRAERLNPTLHAFIRLTPEAAMDQARAAEARIMREGPRGPLDGIPIAHKDIYETAGVPTTGHSRLLEHHVPKRDAAVVRKWAEAGAISLGKLATHEFAWGGPSFDLPWPPARNPWDPERFTGGSSSGTGAAVAAGMILGGTGSDTAGSIRMPAAFCGVAGIKPTYGLCSRVGVLPLAHSLDTTGPLAWTAEDCAILLQAIAGHDPEDPSSANRPAPDLLSRLDDGVKGLRIGVVRHFHEEDLAASPAVRDAVARAAETLRGLGAGIEEVRLPSLHDFNAAGWLILAAEAYAVHEEWLRTRFHDYGEYLRERLALAALITGADYVQAQRRRRELCAAVAAAMARCDLLLTAAQPGEARPIGQMGKWASFEAPNLTIPFNLTGQPAMVVCAGFGEGGMPVGVQLAGRPFEDATVLRAAHAFERATAWRQRRPALAASG